MNVKYELRKCEKGYKLKIFESDIKFDDEKSFSKEYIDKVKKAFSDSGKDDISYSLEKYEECQIKELIIDNLSRVSENRKELLREGFDTAYRLCIEKEKQKGYK